MLIGLTGTMEPLGVGVVEAACPDRPGLRSILLRPDGHAARVHSGGDTPDAALRHRLRN